MAVLTATILSRFESVVEATEGSPRRGFQKAQNRFTLDREPDGGRDGLYRCELRAVETTRQAFGTSEVWRNAGQVVVAVAYFRGGGDAGGATGGDRKSVNRRVLDDVFALVSACENDATYDAQNTGIRVVRWRSFSRAADLPRAEIWEIAFDVEWQATLVTS